MDGLTESSADLLPFRITQRRPTSAPARDTEKWFMRKTARLAPPLPDPPRANVSAWGLAKKRFGMNQNLATVLKKACRSWPNRYTHLQYKRESVPFAGVFPCKSHH